MPSALKSCGRTVVTNTSTASPPDGFPDGFPVSKKENPLEDSDAQPEIVKANLATSVADIFPNGMVVTARGSVKSAVPVARCGEALESSALVAHAFKPLAISDIDIVSPFPHVNTRSSPLA